MGAATAEHLAELGATVVVLGRRKDKPQDVVHRIEAAGGTALALPVDVTDRAAVQPTAHQVADRFGPTDLVFNNAGLQLTSGVEELKVDNWQRQIDLDLNITGLMNVIAAFLPHRPTPPSRASPPTSSTPPPSRPPASWRSSRSTPGPRPASATSPGSCASIPRSPSRPPHKASEPQNRWGCRPSRRPHRRARS
ncbi:SDR family oxidoreductase [Streptomyces sp. NPDC057950]|uniref:SDR family oxidoreductase n=1 Tax=Streptomyces sp. NPDC057950 TaxID=3346288 RepID=UPI0036E32C54